MTSRQDKAAGMFANSYNCAQAVLSSFSDISGIDEDTSCKIACAFGAGGGRKQYCCGAVSGSLMVISALTGRSKSGSKSDQENSYSLAREFFSRFELLHKTSECKKLLDGIDFLTTEGQERYKQEGMSTRCTGFITDSIAILEDILNLA